jgi:hypothetical protein
LKLPVLILLVGSFSLTTVILGWWAVPLVAAGWGWMAAWSMRQAVAGGLAAALSWALLLGWSALTGQVALLISKLGALAGVPGAAFVALTLLLPFALAVGAAAVPALLKRPKD